MSTELRGSPKQISWAKKIRTDRLNIWKMSDPSLFKEVETALEDESSASWWITHREKGLRDVLSYIAEGGEMRVTMMKPKIIATYPTVASPNNKESFSGLNDVHRNVGEVRDIATGEVVVDPECPF